MRDEEECQVVKGLGLELELDGGASQTCDTQEAPFFWSGNRRRIQWADREVVKSTGRGCVLKDVYDTSST